MNYINWADAASQLSARGEPYVIVTLLNSRGSTPRNNGTKMLVTVDQIIDTIGGGQLEHSAIEKARLMLVEGKNQQHMDEIPLGPKMGQCCGGRITLLWECFAASPIQIAVFGAGHVGKALISILAQLPVQVRWIDSRAEAFTDHVPEGVERVLNSDPETEISHLNPGAYVVVLTHNHPLDYTIAEAALQRNDTAYLGVIGSNTKAKRFRMRLAYWGLPKTVIDHMRCPMGFAEVTGKHPMEVAVSIAAELISTYQHRQRLTETFGPTKHLELKPNFNLQGPVE